MVEGAKTERGGGIWMGAELGDSGQYLHKLRFINETAFLKLLSYVSLL